ncbi:hypothetical protein SASPL_146184 [Salvia splendens]|uniref:Pollen Ole e 1 allergen and extensin family protein n=1 Tax=Salvia splendens TaxID=180675 RepID=A0A8X8Z5H8_SALSN|nr:uncharacterized protein LOC121777783 [Salvia splendens]KAG6391982.1 hypothetical protein SASPL_146184 [Salvia splendens]
MRMMSGVWFANFVVFYLVAVGGSSPARKKVIIEGYVSCVYCVMEGGPGSVIKTDLLPGAVVKLQCNNRKKGSWEEQTETGGDGEFSFKPVKVTSWGAHKCNIFLVSSPRAVCPVIIYGEGVLFKPAAINATSPFQLYTVRPLAFYPPPYTCV